MAYFSHPADGHVFHVMFSGQMAYDGMVMEKQ